MKGQRGGFHQAPYLSCLVKLLLASISPLNGKGWVVIAEEEKCMPLTGWIYCRNFNRRWDNCLCVKLQTQLWLINDLKVKECCYPFVPPPPPPLPLPGPGLYAQCVTVFVLVAFTESSVRFEFVCFFRFQMLRVNMGRVVYPTYTVNRQTQIFSCRQDLIR